MKKYRLIACPRCHSFTYIKGSQKTRRCIQCGYRIDCSRVQVLYTTDNAKEIVYALKLVKTNPRLLGKRSKQLKLLRLRFGIQPNKEPNQKFGLDEPLLHRLREAMFVPNPTSPSFFEKRMHRDERE